MKFKPGQLIRFRFTNRTGAGIYGTVLRKVDNQYYQVTNENGFVCEYHQDSILEAYNPNDLIKEIL